MRALVITVIVLILLVVGADVAGRALAESKAGEAIATQAKLDSAPDVTIHGFSFLAQALPGSYSKITIQSGNIDLNVVHNVAATVDLYDVTYPLSQALSGGTDQLAAGRAELRATIPNASLAAALQKTGITLSAGSNGTIKLSTTVSVAGHALPVSAQVTATFSGGALQLAANAVDGVGIPAVISDQLTKALSLRIPLTNLPIPIQAASVAADASGLIITAEALNVTASELR